MSITLDDSDFQDPRQRQALSEPGVWGEITAGLRVSRPVLVARLLELDAAGALTTAHVRAGAQVGGVTARTVWRWLEAARAEGRVERRPRARLELSDQAWEVLAQAGGNVSVLHRHLKAAGDDVPSLASLHRVVRRDLQCLIGILGSAGHGRFVMCGAEVAVPKKRLGDGSSERLAHPV
ncbi:hypothetical protein ACH4C6_35690 [Streptomyces sp. NPDC017943]|uniref:hypothetical protein n=1 Tax=Streptomyces sp. NPDC017943 TaxID=3365019 RepID=UPI00379213ED